MRGRRPEDESTAGAQGAQGPQAPDAGGEEQRRSGAQRAAPGGGDGPEGGDDGDDLVPRLEAPRGGGALRPIGEKFSVNAATGTGGFSVPIAMSPARALTPEVSLSYDSGAGNGPFGMGVRASVPSVKRKTDKGLPRYRDHEESDIFMFSDAEDLVPVVDGSGVRESFTDGPGNTHTVYPYRPRVEGGFAQIERWVEIATGDVHWRVRSRDNVTSFFGQSPESRIADPANPSKIFQWLLNRVEDDRGNVSLFVYKAENDDGVDTNAPNERERFHTTSDHAAKYLKRIHYGIRPGVDTTGTLTAADFQFEVVFDYGEHELTTGTDQLDILPDERTNQTWPVRVDTFSNFRPGFDVRTRRLCQRVLVFHRLEGLSGPGAQPTLVRSTDMVYTPDPVGTRLASVVQRGYVLDNGTGFYDHKAFPAVTLSYIPREVGQTIQFVDPGSLTNVPGGVDGQRMRLVDLDGEGLPGILTEQSGNLYYKRPEGDARFGAIRALPSQASLGGLNAGRMSLLDLDGDGRRSLARVNHPTPGYYARSATAEKWEPFRTFRQVPNVNLDAPNVRYIDINGDGLSDILVHEQNRVTWYPSLGADGFDAPIVVGQPGDDEAAGPQLVWQDAQRAVFYADMTGDGLSDIVRVQNGRIVYWPNLGYGRFGRMIEMSGVPAFDRPDLFEASRVRLADIDGSGANDLVYLGGNGVKMWFNEAGNGFGGETELTQIPRVDTMATVEVVDLLGNGTACLVWSTALPGREGSQVAYVDLMAQGKPYLLQSVTNNLGMTTTVTYAPSTKFYLADRAAGKPWITKLPFPVQVVEQVEVFEAITERRFVSRYRYHHGYFDGPEREFRGFGLVEQEDTESFADYSGLELPNGGHQIDDDTLWVPPILTKTWFHTGAYIGADSISRQYADEYYDGAGATDAVVPAELPDTVLPAGLSPVEAREAVRALRGRPLRSEVYALNRQHELENPHPYTVAETNYTVRLEQARGDRPYGVFFVHDRESLTYGYERDPTDPRIAQGATLVVGPYGDVERTIAVGHPRVSTGPHPTEQTLRLLTVAEADFAHIEPSDRSVYRLGVPTESRSFELVDAPVPGQGATVYSFAELESIATQGVDVPYDGTDANPHRRLLAKSRQIYYANDNTNPLTHGSVGDRALPYETRTMAFTRSQIDTVFDDVSNSGDGLLDTEGEYLNEDSAWWTVSGRQVFDSAQFYLPIQAIDVFGNTTTITYDDDDLMVASVTDPLGNVASADYDYRVMAPLRVTDPNGNTQEAAFDELGMVVATAIIGKNGEGDTLTHPTTSMTYDLTASPVSVHTVAREVHYADDQTEPPVVQESYAYFDGSGRVVQQKVQAEPDPATPTTPRWVGNGRTVVDNKGNPVKQYEPFFSATSDYEDEESVVATGVTALLHYDPLGRNVRTDFPDGTHARVEFTGWRVATYDQNDTLTTDTPWYEDRIGLPAGDPDRRAAEQAFEHRDTPTVAHLDSLGRVYETVENLALDGATPTPADLLTTSQALDIQGNVLTVTDPRGIVVQTSTYGMLGQVLRVVSPDAGTRWALADTQGAPLRAWDDRDHTRRWSYDALRRPTHAYVQTGTEPEKLLQRVVYGESLGVNAAVDNHRGQVYQTYDSAGLNTAVAYDFKGNPLESSRRMALTVTETHDWSELAALTDPSAMETAANDNLETQVYTVTTQYDALNRPTQQTAPDATTPGTESVTKPQYNEAGLLESVDVDIRGAGADTGFVSNVAYNARGQRTLVVYGNGTEATYTYDPKTFRVTRISTERTSDNEVLQDLRYHYDPVGNVAEIRDEVQDDVYFNGTVVEAHQQFVYDPKYRLVQATGREHAAKNTAQQTESGVTWDTVLDTNNGAAMARYTEDYQYDASGNLTQVQHTQTPSGSWTRTQTYATTSNRLVDMTTGGNTVTYSHDAHGNFDVMPHLPSIGWDENDQMQSAQLSAGASSDVVYFVYDSAGNRVRKVKLDGNDAKTHETLYFGGYEVYREFTGSAGSETVQEELHSLHVSDGTGRVCLVETRTVDAGTVVSSPVNVLRYQLSNHLSTVTVELDGSGQVLTVEEFHPYGTTAYRARVNGDVSYKRYRYGGAERDEETGLYSMGARYYACWLGRWTAADPIGIGDGTNVFGYVRGNPVRLRDPSGTFSAPGPDKYPNLQANPEDALAEADYGSGYLDYEDGTEVVGDAPVSEPEPVSEPKPTRRARPKPKPEPEPEPSGDPEPRDPPPPAALPASETADPNADASAAASPTVPPEFIEAGEQLLEFGTGLLEGVGTRAAIAYGIGFAAGLLGATVAAPVLAVVSVGLAASTVYNLVNGGAEEAAERAGRVFSGEGTPEDFRSLGRALGGGGRGKGGRVTRGAASRGAKHGGRTRDEIGSRLNRLLRGQLRKIEELAAQPGISALRATLAGRQVRKLAEKFLGPNAQVVNRGKNGEIWMMSEDGLRMVRLPTQKASPFAVTGRQANFHQRRNRNADFFDMQSSSNVHINVR